MKKYIVQVLTSGITRTNLHLFTDCIAIIIIGYSTLSLQIVEFIANCLIITSLFITIKTKGFSLKAIFYTNEKFGTWRWFVEIYIYIALFVIPDENPLVRSIVANTTIVLLIGLIICGYFYIMKKQMEQRDNIETLTAEICSISAKNQLIDGDKLRRIFRRQFAAVDRLAAVRYESADEKALKKNYAREADRMIGELEPNSAEMEQLKQYVDSTHDNLITRFEEAFPNLNPYYYQLFLYTSIGLLPRAMSVLFDIPVETIYNRKSRLKNIIAAAEASDRTQYLAALA